MEERKELTLATEIIRTLKKVIFALILTNILTVAGFLWYISLPAEETANIITQNTDDIEHSDVNQVVGGNLDGKSNADSGN